MEARSADAAAATGERWHGAPRRRDGLAGRYWAQRAFSYLLVFSNVLTEADNKPPLLMLIYGDDMLETIRCVRLRKSFSTVSDKIYVVVPRGSDPSPLYSCPLSS